jgi:hypothetical protein
MCDIEYDIRNYPFQYSLVFTTWDNGIIKIDIFIDEIKTSYMFNAQRGEK